MEIRLSEDLIAELHALRNYIRSEEDINIQSNQEFILGVISLLLNPLFRQTIKTWRKRFKIPKFNQVKTLNGHIEWAMSQQGEIPFEDTDKKIIALCKACHLNPRIYGSFIIDYLYYGEILPFRSESQSPFSNESVFIANDEFRYKSRVEVDYGMPRQDEYTGNPQKLYIRLFNNTSKKGLIKFIEANWKQISSVKKQLNLYPQKTKFKYFKRDIEIYLLFLTGNKVNKIADTIQDENVPAGVTPEKQFELEEKYALDEKRIYNIIDNVNTHLQLYAE